MKKDEIQKHLSFWRERQASEHTAATIFRFKMCCAGRGSGDLEPARYPDESTRKKRVSETTAKKTKKKKQSCKAPTTASIVNQEPEHVATDDLATMAGNLQQDATFQFDINPNNIQGIDMANHQNFLDINMGQNHPQPDVNTQSSLFFPNDMNLGGTVDDEGLGSLQLHPELLGCLDPGFTFGIQGSQPFNPTPMMANGISNPSVAQSNHGGLVAGAPGNEDTARNQCTAGHADAAGPSLYSDNSLDHVTPIPGPMPNLSLAAAGEFLGNHALPDDQSEQDTCPSLNNTESQGLVQDITNVLNVPFPAGIIKEPSILAVTGTKRKAADSENDGVPKKKSWPTINANLAPAEDEEPSIGRPARERRVTQKVATNRAEEAAAKAAREAEKLAKAKKAQEKKKQGRPGRK